MKFNLFETTKKTLNLTFGKFLFKNLKRVVGILGLILVGGVSTAQPGKDGALTVSASNTVINRYARVVTDVSQGSNTVMVDDINNLNRNGVGYFPSSFVSSGSVYASNNLSAGDLIMIYQAQGAVISNPNSIDYGVVTSYNGAGRYELFYVESVSGNTITLSCGASFPFVSSGYVQVIRIPQYTTLTVNSTGSVAAIPWGHPSFGGSNASALTRRRGGVLAAFASNVDNDGVFSADGAGFRGGTVITAISSGNASFIQGYFDTSTSIGGEKGESIAGYREDYDNLFGGRYGRGAPANGGGGGNGHNAGGGGGANGGVLANWFRGAGVMNDFTGSCGSPGAWVFDPDYIANGNSLTTSSGGGRGGYSLAQTNANACVLGPSYPANTIAPGVPAADVLRNWSGDRRDAVGGLGGRPMVSSGFQNQVFMGGGGGAGHGNNEDNQDGGDGGGFIFLSVNNSISGDGMISANGQNALPTISLGTDAPGGGGGGGSVLISCTSLSDDQAIRANGGDGGDQIVTLIEAQGPGGGGGGGVIVLDVDEDDATKTVNGGSNGNTNSLILTEFTANGATSGNVGTIVNTDLLFGPSACSTDLQVQKTASSLNPVQGTNVTFFITVTNNSQNTASSIVVNDNIPNGFSVVSVTPSAGTWSAPNWNIPSLAGGASRTLTIVATVLNSGNYTNTATVIFNGTDTDDSNNISTITLLPSFFPVANDDVGPTPVEDGSNGSVNALANDTDLNGNPSAPTNGANQFVFDLNSITIGVQTSVTTSQGVWSYSTVNGVVTFNPADNFNGTATLTYTLCDPSGLCNQGTITFLVQAVNDAPVAVNNTATTNEDTSVTLSNILANDSDVDNSLLISNIDLNTSVSGVQTSITNAFGTWILNTNNGSVTFTPTANFNGTATLTYEICDTGNPVLCAQANLIVTVNPANDAPLANNDNGGALLEDGVNGTVAILANDTDADGNPTVPTNGTGQFSVDLNTAIAGVQTTITNAQGVWTYNTANGIVTFDPANNFNGTATLAYILCDAGGLCDQADITFTVQPVNDAPEAVDDSATTAEDIPVTISNIIVNDSDIDNVLLAASIDLDPSTAGVQTSITNDFGTWTLDTVNGNVVFTPATNFNGTATTPYEICDTGNPVFCAQADLIVTVTAVNDAPIVDNEYITISWNTQAFGDLIDEGDFDIDGELVLNPIPLIGPLNGNILVNSIGNFTYTPSVGYWGNEVIVFRICDTGTPLPSICVNDTIFITVLPCDISNLTLDCDNDGLNNGLELIYGTDPYDNDTDNDGWTDGGEVILTFDPLDSCIPNWNALATNDCDEDGLTNADENLLDTDPLTADTDGDGLNDGLEVIGGSDPLNPCDPNPNALATNDCDNDGLTNSEEANVGTDTANPDSDGDGVNDGAEVSGGSDPLDSCDPNPLAFPLHDCDGDGINNSDEIELGTNPLDADTDADGVNDGDEVNGSSDPLNPCDPNPSSLATNDCDNDGLTNAEEIINGTDQTNPDTDGDGMNDGDEVSGGSDPLSPCDPNPNALASNDCDDDGITNLDEVLIGTDPTNPDTDGDGFRDGEELENSSDPLNPCDPNPNALATNDCDNDGLINSEESIIGTDPANPDTDADGINDGDEVSGGSDPLNPCDPNSNALATNDCDNDGISNIDEAIIGTDPTNPDTDGDGINDGDEVGDGSDPLNPCDPNPSALGTNDCDNDGLTNTEEINNGTDPANPDTDGDGVNDGDEVEGGSDPLNPCDPNPNALATNDCDNDGITNMDEEPIGTDPTNPDTDGDGIDDGDEVNGGSDPLNPCDPNISVLSTNDCDGDGLDILEEIANGTDPSNPDTEGDGMSDGDEVNADTDPLNPCDPNPNALLTNDCDNDGITNVDEGLIGTDPTNPDTDGDGILDGGEILVGTDPNNPDTDGDGIFDGVEVTSGSDSLDPCDPNNEDCISDVVVPQAITPDYDGINDFLVITGIENHSDNTIKIFNRWGNIVFESENYDNVTNVWDGRNYGNGGSGFVPEGTYFYLLEFKKADGENEIMSGYIFVKTNLKE